MLLRVVLAFALAVTANSAFAQEESQPEDDHPVKPEELSALIDQADRVMVYDEAEIENAKRLYSSTNVKVISDLKAATVVEAVLDENIFRCLCIGTPEIRLFRQQKELVRFTFVLGTFVRATIWSREARILDEEKLLRWFDARGIRGPRRESMERHADEVAERANTERWMNGMPASVRPLWPQMMRARRLDSGMRIFVPQGSPQQSKAPPAGEPAVAPEIRALSEALAKEFLDPKQRIRALFVWFASGSGSWTAFTAYEMTVEELLLEYKTPELLAATEGVALSEAEKEGAARFFAGWTFSLRRSADNALLPAELKRALLVHSLKSADKDKRQRARQAFGRGN